MRKVFFWVHLSVGLTAGLVILSSAVSGMMMAFETQIVEFAERKQRMVELPRDGAGRLGFAALAEHVRKAEPELTISGFTLRSDPSASVAISLGRDAMVFVNPYTGAILGRGSKARDFLHAVEEWHRWLWKKETGKPVTGASCLLFLFMILSGLYLWWPRRVMSFNHGLTGKARDWNWHNVIGFWCSPVLLVVALTGLVMAYPWANALLFRMAGDVPPAQKAAGAKQEKAKDGETKIEAPAPIGPGQRGPSGLEVRNAALDFALFDKMTAEAAAQMPDWKTMSTRLKDSAPVTLMLVAKGAKHPGMRSQMTFDAVTGERTKWEPYEQQSRGKKWRAWARYLHTGQAAGLPGQILAFIAAAGASVLVYTGFSLSWRRFFKSGSNGKSASGPQPRIKAGAAARRLSTQGVL